MSDIPNTIDGLEVFVDSLPSCPGCGHLLTGSHTFKPKLIYAYATPDPRLANLLSDEPKDVGVGLTLRDEMDAIMEAFGDIAMLESKAFPGLIYAYHSARKRADDVEQQFWYEHFVHHDGATSSDSELTAPRQCDAAVALR